MDLDEATTIVIGTHGFPRWVGLLLVELALLEVWAARDRLIARGYTHLTISIESPV